MRSLRFVLLLFSASLLPFLFSGCGTTTSNNTPQNPGNPGSSGNPGSGSAAAYVYVSNRTGAAGSPGQITAYSADANGQLTPVPGSPFSQNVESMAVTGNYLMAASNAGPDLNTYTIGSNGAITLASQFDYTQQTGFQSNTDTVCGYIGDLYFDVSGQSLYTVVGNIQCSNNNAVASFSVDSSTGSLSYLGNLNIGYESSGQASFLGDDTYAYAALYDACMYGGISAYARSSNGLLGYNASFTRPASPAPPPGATSSSVALPGYAAGLTATDTANHVAIAEYPCFAQGGTAATQIQLATYTADANGNLTTADTYATMPSTQVSSPQDMKMSPSGTLLAVGGVGGLEVFHFNGASSITTDTGLLTTDSIAQMFWDKNNHLYAITLSAGSNVVSPGKLHVFTVTDSAATEAPGSPYTITTPWNLAVQSQ